MDELLRELRERGFLHQCTNFKALEEQLAEKKITVYAGYDPTGKSLHVGHLLSIMMLRWFSKYGHRVIVLIGGATSQIGDPTGKDEQRQLLTFEQVEDNISSLTIPFYKLLGSSYFDIVNNYEWLSKLNYLEFLKDIGKYFSVNRMLSFDSVKMRLERQQPLSFVEFNYMIFQGYDFWHLYKKYNCSLQIGGSDQWGNIVNGVDLVKRIESQEVFGLTSPLITTASGHKMGKTAMGAVWLNEELMTPYNYWQFWRNTDDADVERYLKYFTDLSLREIQELSILKGAQINEAKKILADEATKILHGTECLSSIHTTVREIFEKGEGSEQKGGQLLIKRRDLPMFVDHLYVMLNLCQTKGEAKRLIQAGGARINDVKIEDIKKMIRIEDFIENRMKISAGKKQHVFVILEE